MSMNTASIDLNGIMVVGDRLLIRPVEAPSKTDTGLYLPPGLHKKESVFTGYVMKVGPGYPVPKFTEDDEFWKEKKEEVKYMPLQARPGDLAVYLQREAIEVVFNNEPFVIVPYSAVLLLHREDDLSKI